MPSLGSLCVPSKLLAHLLLSWVKSACWIEVDYCLLLRCVAIVTHLGILATIKLNTTFYAHTSLLDTYSGKEMCNYKLRIL
jgi:hypothetical protein